MLVREKNVVKVGGGIGIFLRLFWSFCGGLVCCLFVIGVVFIRFMI